MSHEFNPDVMFKMAADYINRGFKTVKLHWPNPDGTCSCGKSSHRRGGTQEKQRGKHPVEDEWQNYACGDEDTLADWVSTGLPFNIGVQLGPKSGIIDVEWDNEKAKLFAEEMGLTTIETPTFISGRSEHRLFLWDGALEALPTGVVKPNGLEVRAGARGSGIQSVFPPSFHWSGVQYRWKDGFGLDDVSIQPLPDHFLRMIVNTGGDGASADVAEPSESTKHNRRLLHSGAGEGERHDFMKNVACRFAFNEPNAHSEKIQADLVKFADCVNKSQCKPPLDISEVASLVSWACDRKRKMRETGTPIPSSPDEIETFVSKAEEEDECDVSPVSRGWAMHGLAWSETVVKSGGKEKTVGEWMPGNWKIQMIESDPPEIVLHVPNWSKLPGGGKITMPLTDYLDPRAVAKRIFETTRRIIVDADPKEWHAIWRGLPAKGTGDNRRPRVDGLAVKLMAAKTKADNVEVGASSLRYAVVAGWLMEAFKRATKPKNEETAEPNESGRPCWVKPEEMWFKWAKTWEEIERAHILNSGERSKMRRMICDEVGAEDLHEIRYLIGGVRHAYVVFDNRWISAVERLAAGRKAAEETPV